MTPLVELRNVTKRYGSTLALDDVSLQVEPGEFVVVLGPSGCGKTTLLRILAGLTRPDEGILRYDGRDLAEVPAHDRPFGFVFQEPALFPHLDVAGNVGFGLEVRGDHRASREARVRELLDLVHLEGYRERGVHELSGGERQRVALARALAPGPPVLLLDEPLSALDRALRMGLRREVRELHRDLDLTTLYVTHDQEEALALADRLVLMRDGRVVQTGPPRSLLEEPASPWAASFLGAANAVEGRVAGTDPLLVETALGTLGDGDVTLEAPEDPAVGKEVHVLLPPDALRVRPHTEGDGRVVEARPAAGALQVAVRVGGSVLEVEAPPDLDVVPGTRVALDVAPGTYPVHLR